MVRCVLSANENMVLDKDDDDDGNSTDAKKSAKKMFNFASQAAGAVILNYSPEDGMYDLFIEICIYILICIFAYMYVILCIT